MAKMVEAFGKRTGTQTGNVLVSGVAMTGATRKKGIEQKKGIGPRMRELASRRAAVRSFTAKNGNQIKKTKPPFTTEEQSEPVPFLAGLIKEANTTLTIKFPSAERNLKLIALLADARIKYNVDRNGEIHFSSADEEQVEEKVSDLRSEVFPEWQMISCPNTSLQDYREYMKQHRVPFEEEVIDGDIAFLIPRHYRPHTWQFGDLKSRQVK